MSLSPSLVLVLVWVSEKFGNSLEFVIIGIRHACLRLPYICLHMQWGLSQTLDCLGYFAYLGLFACLGIVVVGHNSLGHKEG